MSDWTRSRQVIAIRVMNAVAMLLCLYALARQALMHQWAIAGSLLVVAALNAGVLALSTRLGIRWRETAPETEETDR